MLSCLNWLKVIAAAPSPLAEAKLSRPFVQFWCALGGGLSWADGIASTVEGQGSEVKTSTQFQGATASIYGAMNEIDATADKKPYDGVANSIVGAVNATKDANAALIFGAPKDS